MATILFAWELGGDYGHLARLLPLARELAARGHRPVFVLRDLLGAEAILAPHGLTAFQAPLWLGQVSNLPEPISYPEMLMRFGFLNGRALTGICRAWRNLLALLRPDLLVLDHAPTALLASRGLGLPRLHCGDGFCIPPAERPLPPFRWWQKENLVRLQDSEQHVLATANTVLLDLGAPPLARFSELFACDDQLFLSFAELDHYPARSGADFLGPVFALGQGVEPNWPPGPGPRLFAYLKPGYGALDKVLSALAGFPASVLVHLPGAARKTVATYSTGTMAIAAEPLAMETLRRSCDLCLCHGGAGTTAAMLLAGKPLVLLPMHMEQTMTARRLSDLGVAVTVVPEACGQLPRLLKKVLATPELAAAAGRFAARHGGYDQQATIRQAADRGEALLGAAR